MTGGPQCSHQWLAMIPLPAWPLLLSTLCELLCILGSWLRQGGARGYCDTAFPFPVLRLQEFVLIPGIVKFDFVCAAVNPWSSPEVGSYRFQNETIITLPFRKGLPTKLFLLEVPASLQFQNIEFALHKTIGQDLSWCNPPKFAESISSRYESGYMYVPACIYRSNREVLGNAWHW